MGTDSAKGVAVMKDMDRLMLFLEKTEPFAVAYSGGLDSSLLLWAAASVRPGTTAITYVSPIHPVWEKDNACAYASALKTPHITVTSDILAVEGLRDNLPGRCYYCRRALYRRIKKAAEEQGLHAVIEGSNADDYAKNTPGTRAARECGIISPLAECGFTKEDVRRLANIAGIPARNRATYACLATRLPAGERLSPDKLHIIEQAELLLHKSGYDNIRVRMQGYCARIELEKNELLRFILDPHLDELHAALLAMGFDHVSVDIGGYSKSL